MADQFSKVKWGDGFSVTDEGAGVIRVDGGGGGGGGGIQFDTDNEGGYLFVRANAMLGGTGLDLRDNTSGGINIESEGDGDIGVYCDGTGGLYVDSEWVTIKARTNSLLLRGLGGGGISMLSDGGTEIADDDFGMISIGAAGDGIAIEPNTGQTLRLINIPTTDPGVSHAVWNDSGTLKISP